MEYINTPRRFDFPLELADRALLDELEALARRCWTAFDLHGYARVDFRVDNDALSLHFSEPTPTLSLS